MDFNKRKCSRCFIFFSKPQREPINIICDLCFVCNNGWKVGDLGLCKMCFHGYHLFSDTTFENYVNKEMDLAIYESMKEFIRLEEVESAELSGIKKTIKVDLENHDCYRKASCWENNLCKPSSELAHKSCTQDIDERHFCDWHSSCKDVNHSCIPGHKCDIAK